MAQRRPPAITLRLVMLEMQGFDLAYITSLTNYASSTISTILASPEAINIRREIQARVIDTVAEIQTDLQAIAPTLLQEKIQLALTAKSENVRNNALTGLLELAGHVPVKQVEIRRATLIEEEYKDKTEEAIKAEIMDGLGAAESPKAPIILH